MECLESRQNLRTLNTNPIDLAVIEYVTPYKICAATFLHEYIYLKCPKFRRDHNETANSADDSMSEAEDRLNNSVQFDPLQRKDFCRLLLNLIQNVDMNLTELATKILANQDGLEIHPGIFHDLKFSLRFFSRVVKFYIIQVLITYSQAWYSEPSILVITSLSLRSNCLQLGIQTAKIRTNRL